MRQQQFEFADDMDFKPGDHNYKRGWREWAKPQYDELPEAVRQLHMDIIGEKYGVLKQGGDLDIPMSYGLREVFESFDDETLAHSAHVIYFLGHWASNGKYSCSWWFTNMANQVLSKRLGVDNSIKQRGLFLRVHDGLIRLTYSNRDTWQWEEICTATRDHLARCQQVVDETGDYDDAVRVLKKEFGPVRPDFVVPQPWDVQINKALIGSGMKGVEIVSVNFDPHPFVITNKHVERSNGMFLDPTTAPCGHRGCTLLPDQHTHERALVIEGFVDGIGQRERLEKLVPLLEELKIDGLVFARDLDDEEESCEA